MSNPLNRSEIKWGSIYAVIQYFLLGEIALLLNYLLRLPAWVLQVGIFALNFLFTILIFRKFLLSSAKAALRHPFKVLGFSLLGLLIYYISSFLVSIVILVVCPDYGNLNDAAISEMSRQSGIWMLVSTVLFVPVAEEAVFRGLLFRGIYDRSPFAAWTLSVALFSAVHIVGYIGLYDPLRLLLAFIQYLPAGLCLAFAYKETDTIIAPILMHTCVNLIGMSFQ